MNLLILYSIYKIRPIIGVGLFIIFHRTNFLMFVSTLLSIMFIIMKNVCSDNHTLVCVEIVYLAKIFRFTHTYRFRMMRTTTVTTHMTKCFTLAFTVFRTTVKTISILRIHVTSPILGEHISAITLTQQRKQWLSVELNR